MYEAINNLWYLTFMDTTLHGGRRGRLTREMMRVFVTQFKTRENCNRNWPALLFESCHELPQAEQVPKRRQRE